MAGEEVAKKYKTLIFLAGSASAEFFADIGLCPWEAVKVNFCVDLPALIRVALLLLILIRVRVSLHSTHITALHRILQVKVQTVPGFAKGLTDGFPKFVAQEGWGGYA